MEFDISETNKQRESDHMITGHGNKSYDDFIFQEREETIVGHIHLDCFRDLLS